MASDPSTPVPRALRASVGLSVLAAVLLACGGAVEAAGNLLGPSTSGDRGGSHPTAPAPVRPTPDISSSPAAPSPSCPPSASPTQLPEPLPTATTPSPSPERPPKKGSKHETAKTTVPAPDSTAE